MNDSPSCGWIYAKRMFGLCVMLVIFVGALWLLHRKVSERGYGEVFSQLAIIPLWQMGCAAVLTVANYCVLIGYDWMAVRAIGHPLPMRRVSMAAIVGYAASYSFGTLIGGNAVRFRLYTSWGLTPLEVLRLVALLGLIFWLGVFALAGTLFVWQPLEVPQAVRESGIPLETVRPLGWCLLGLVAVYFMVCGAWRRPIRFRGRDYRLPTVRASLLQILVASVDMMVAASVLYVLLPKSYQVSYLQFLPIYLLGLVAVVVTHVPMGPFELVIVQFAEQAMPANETPAVVAALLAWRVIYLVMPMLIAGTWMGSYEMRRLWWQPTTSSDTEPTSQAIDRTLASSTAVSRKN